MSWSAGDVIVWGYRNEAAPARVVRDTGDELVVWIASGTPMVTAMHADGRPFRDRPVDERFVGDKVFALHDWYGDGVLRITRAGEPWSSWLFRRDGEPWGWYGNLEDPMQRMTTGVSSRDHVLDVWLDLTTGRVGWKDEDELEACVRVGRFTAEQATQIRINGEAVFAAMERRDYPYDGSWLDWTPDPSWTIPALDDEYLALVGTPAYELFPDDDTRT